MNPRVFLPYYRLSVGQVVEVTGEDGHHLARVLRVQPGETMAFGAGGKGYLARVANVDAKAGVVSATVTDELPGHEPPVQVYLLQGLPKAEKTESIIQHCTELGVSGFAFVQSARAVTRLDGKDAKKQQSRIERWQRVIREAAGQSQRDIVPILNYLPKLTDVSKWMEEVAPGLVLFLDEEEQVVSIYEALSEYIREHKYAPEHFTNANPPDPAATPGGGIPPIVLCVGPEGGWDEAERYWFKNQLSAKTVTLGPRILRTETAGLVGSTAVLYHFHALGG